MAKWLVIYRKITANWGVGGGGKSCGRAARAPRGGLEAKGGAGAICDCGRGGGEVGWGMGALEDTRTQRGRAT